MAPGEGAEGDDELEAAVMGKIVSRFMALPAPTEVADEDPTPG